MVFHLGTLIGLQNVFKDKGMESEAFAEFLDILNLMNTDDIDPCDGGCVFECETFLYRTNLSLVEIHLIVVDDCDLYLFCLFFADVDERAGREPCLF